MSSAQWSVFCARRLMRGARLCGDAVPRRAFTLIEMLLVVAIIGILITMLAPRLQMLGAPRVAAAARVLSQATRYARTMALLHQVETELRVSGDGVVSVTAAGGAPSPERGPGHDAAGESPGGVAMSAAGASEGSVFASGFDDGADRPPARAATADGDDIGVERKLDGVTVAFLGFRDNIDSTAPAPGAGVETVGSSVRFRSNGTCRPHRYKLMDVTGVTLYLDVDLIGTTTIIDDEHDLQ